MVPPAPGLLSTTMVVARRSPTFWETAGRFAVLAKAEYLDRLEAATRTAERLAARLERSADSDGRAGGELVELLSTRLYVLDESSLASTAQTHALFERLRADDRVLLVGDVRHGDRDHRGVQRHERRREARRDQPTGRPGRGPLDAGDVPRLSHE